MRRGLERVGLIALALCVAVVLMTGCAKKVGLQDGAAVGQPKMAGAQPPAMKPAEPMMKAAEPMKPAAMAPAMKAPGAAKAPGMAPAAGGPGAPGADDPAAKAKKEAADRAAAILKELKIADIHFDFDKSNIKPEAQEVLKKAAPAYLKYRDYKLVIEGHCDERGTHEYNLALGDRRATEAAKFLSDLGIEKERIKTISYGEEMPLDKGHNEEAWAKNRRARFVIFPPVK